MLPLTIHEDKLFVFKFWFGGRLLEGTCHQGEMFCRLQDFQLQQRAQVYHLGCKLTRQGNCTLLSFRDDTCSLWISLRATKAEAILAQVDQLQLPIPGSASTDIDS